jgi:hypothetical protein
MIEFSSSQIWGFAVIQFLGWTGGLLVRCHARSTCGRRRQSACHAFFMLALTAVGIATSITLCVGARWWLLSAATLAGMILLAICDFDRQRRTVTI